RDQNPMPWLQRALERNPVSGRAHLLLAEVLAASGAKQQALFEARLAVESETMLVKVVAEVAARWVTDFDDVAAAVPSGPDGAVFLDVLAKYLATDKDKTALRARCDSEALARDPSRIHPRRRLIEDRLAALASKEPEMLRVCPTRAQCER